MYPVTAVSYATGVMLDSEANPWRSGPAAKGCRVTAKEIRDIVANHIIEDREIKIAAAASLAIVLVRHLNDKLKRGISKSSFSLYELLDFGFSEPKDFEWSLPYERHEELTDLLTGILKQHYESMGFTVKSMKCHCSSRANTVNNHDDHYSDFLTSTRDLILNSMNLGYDLAF